LLFEPGSSKLGQVFSGFLLGASVIKMPKTSVSFVSICLFFYSWLPLLFMDTGLPLARDKCELEPFCLLYRQKRVCSGDTFANPSAYTKILKTTLIPFLNLYMISTRDQFISINSFFKVLSHSISFLIYLCIFLPC